MDSSEEIRERLPQSFKTLLACVPFKRPRNHDMQLISSTIADKYYIKTGRFKIKDVEVSLVLQGVWYLRVCQSVAK